ncbi:hypothetical protein [Accumulibacter sp.]|uniref:hypothetical protein n=1 Tax=Accumulibacter sp. TaxID=2053492 RepID=UPI0025D3DF5A|nr:hypothetical protein [Accumulibacter sp.]MCP5228538.1 hypothetical protein [Accumulibacter sp.]
MASSRRFTDFIPSPPPIAGAVQSAKSFHAFQPQGTIAMSKRDDYIEKMKLQLDEANAKMNELEAKAREAKADAREKYAQEMGKLRQQSQMALSKLEELRVSGEDSWDSMVAEMEKIRDAFVHSFKYFKSQL